MPRPALSIVRELFARRAAGDREGVLELLDPRIELADGLRDLVDAGGSDARHVETPLHELVELDSEHALGVGRVRIHERGIGLSDSPGAWTFTVRDDRIVRIDAHRSKRAALAAAA